MRTIVADGIAMIPSRVSPLSLRLSLVVLAVWITSLLVLMGSGAATYGYTIIQVAEGSRGLNIGISADGRYVAFDLPTQLPDRNMPSLRSSYTTGPLARRSSSASTAPGIPRTTPTGFLPATSAISGDGRYVVFTSEGTNLLDQVPPDCPFPIPCSEFFIRDRLSGTTEHGWGTLAAISADGRYLALIADSLNPKQVVVQDRVSGIIEMASVNDAGEPSNAGGGNFGTAMSADGRYVAFFSYGSNLVPGAAASCLNASNTCGQIFVRDRVAGTTERVSVDSAGQQGNDDSRRVAISADGRYVAFNSAATNLVWDDTNGISDTFVHDRVTGVTERVSVNSAGQQESGAARQLPGTGYQQRWPLRGVRQHGTIWFRVTTPHARRVLLRRILVPIYSSTINQPDPPSESLPTKMSKVSWETSHRRERGWHVHHVLLGSGNASRAECADRRYTGGHSASSRRVGEVPGKVCRCQPVHPCCLRRQQASVGSSNVTTATGGRRRLLVDLPQRELIPGGKTRTECTHEWLATAPCRRSVAMVCRSPSWHVRTTTRPAIRAAW